MQELAKMTPLRVLHLEDEMDYSDLVWAMLEAEGYNPDMVCVTNKADFINKLQEGPYDLIIADYMLPDYDGLSALKLVRQSNSETPFLLVSGTIGEDAAIRSFKEGASDYVLKNWPEKLMPSVNRVLREATERQNRRKAETALARREKYFRTLSENALDIVTILDRDACFNYNSPSIERTLGHPASELTGRCAFDLVHRDDVGPMSDTINRAIENSDLTLTLEFRFRHKDGSWRYLEAVVTSLLDDPEIAGVVVNSRDSTERKRMEHRNAAFSRLGQRLSTVATKLEAARIITETSDQLFGWDACSFDLCAPDHSTVWSILSIDTIDGERRNVTSSLVEAAPSIRAARVMRHGPELILRDDPTRLPEDARLFGDTTRPSASIMIVPIRNGTVVVGILSIQSYRKGAYTESDLLTLQSLADHCGGALERIRMQDALHESQRQFKAVWDNSVDGMRLTNQDGVIVAVNQSFCRLSGLEEQELVGRPFTEAYRHNVYLEKRAADYRSRFKDRIAMGHLRRHLEFRSGKSLEVDITSCFVESPGQAPLQLSLFRDVTDQAQLEEQLRHSQKMDAIGQLAGGVAHDFNNILTVIQGHATLALKAENLPGNTRASVQQIARASERASTLTRQLLTFSRRQIVRLKRMNLNDAVTQVGAMLARILGEDITLDIITSPMAVNVRADSTMIEQVIMNLAVNARDSMPEGGRLTIQTESREIDEDYAQLRPDARKGSFLCLTIKDTGTGIAPKHMPRIFEPFFTTKEIGKGTGLGLPAVYGIVRLHEGWIEVSSTVGEGSVFKIFLPLIKSEVKPVREPSESVPEHVRGGTETILVAEDEQAVRNLAEEVLVQQGYQVITASSGASALELWQKNRDKIDLLLTDLIMPGGMNGRQLAERIQAEDPKLKVLFSSGFSADVAGKDFVLDEGVNFLPKPYMPNKLAHAVRERLDASNA